MIITDKPDQKNEIDVSQVTFCACVRSEHSPASNIHLWLTMGVTTPVHPLAGTSPISIGVHIDFHQHTNMKCVASAGRTIGKVYDMLAVRYPFKRLSQQSWGV